MDDDEERRGASTFAEAIRAWRQRRGWTQEELSHASGLSTRAIRSLERGRIAQPRRTTVQMLADALQVPREKFVATIRRVGEDGVAEERAGEATAAGPRDDVAAEAARPRELPPDLVDSEIEGLAAVMEALSAGHDGIATALPAAPSAGRGSIATALPAAPSAWHRSITTALPAAPSAERSGTAMAVVPRAPHRPAVVTLSGPEASALAIRAAHRCAEAFPDGQLYANLAWSIPIPPADILRRFLRSLGVPGRPGGRSRFATDELAAAYRTALADRRVLIVLDDAAAEAQVRPLIPAETGCAVLVVYASGGTNVVNFPPR